MNTTEEQLRELQRNFEEMQKAFNLLAKSVNLLVNNKLIAKTTEQRALTWKAYGHVGASSETMYNFFMGIETLDDHVPYDAGDFGRCYGLLLAVPEWKDRVPELAAISYRWKTVSENWDILTLMHENQNPNLTPYIHKLLGI